MTHDFTAKNAVILARVSSKEQEEGHSIAAQIDRLQAYCDRKGLNVLEDFQITESSTVGDRSKFMEMIKYVKMQKSVTAIVADKVDRVQRSFKEYPLLDALIQQGKIELHFNTENYVIHRDSVSQQRLMWSFGVIMAQSYVDCLRDNVKRSIDHKLKNGEYPSNAPLGYLNVKNLQGKSDIVIDEVRGPLVKRIFETYALGTISLAGLVTESYNWGLTTKKGNKVSKSTISDILNNPFYYGIMRIKGDLLPHRYERLIDTGLFRQCQERLHVRQQNGAKWGGKDFIYRGLIKCAITGKTVSGYEKKKKLASGEEATWIYWRSADPERPGKFLNVKEEKITEQIEASIKKLYLPKEMQAEIIKYLQITAKSEKDFREKQIGQLQKESKQIQGRIDRMMDMLLDGDIERDDYNRRRLEYRERQDDIARILEGHRAGDDGFNDAMLNLLDLCRSLPELWAGSNNDEKRRLASTLFANLTLEGESLCITYKKPFCWFANASDRSGWYDLLDSLRTDPESRLIIYQYRNQRSFKS